MWSNPNDLVFYADADKSAGTIKVGYPSQTTYVQSTAGTAPAEFQLVQNYPNPFNGATRIDFSLPQSGVVRLAVYNITGQLLEQLHDGFLAAGHYSAHWQGQDRLGRKMQGGIYLAVLHCGGEYRSVKMMYVPWTTCKIFLRNVVLICIM